MPTVHVPPIAPFPPWEIQVLAPPQFISSVSGSSNDSSSSLSIHSQLSHIILNNQFTQFDYSNGCTSIRSAPTRTYVNNVPIPHQTFQNTSSSHHTNNMNPNEVHQLRSTINHSSQQFRLAEQSMQQMQIQFKQSQMQMHQLFQSDLANIISTSMQGATNDNMTPVTQTSDPSSSSSTSSCSPQESIVPSSH